MSKTLKTIELIYFAFVTFLMLTIPDIKRMFLMDWYESKITHFLIIELIFIGIALIPMFLECMLDDDEKDGVYFIALGWYCLVFSSITIYWMVGASDNILLYLTYPILGCIINLIPIGLANLILMIGHPIMLVSSIPPSQYEKVGEIKSQETGETLDILRKTK